MVNRSPNERTRFSKDPGPHELEVMGSQLLHDERILREVSPFTGEQVWVTSKNLIPVDLIFNEGTEHEFRLLSHWPIVSDSEGNEWFYGL